MRVMLVDDEEWCLEELSEILSKVDGLEITGAYSVATEAMTAMTRDAPDIVFIDVELRGISGLDLAVKLKKQQKETCVVLMSEKECFAKNGFDIGVDDYVLKPLRRERILKPLERAV